MSFKDTKNLYDEYSGVIELKPSDFLSYKKIKNKYFKDKPCLLIFYAPWCGHCNTMKEYISEIAIQFRYQFPIGVVNCENPTNYKLCQKFGIQGFPTIFFQDPKGVIMPYNFGRSKDDIINFIYSNTLK